jgi:Meckelin (Transmembrane protein 67)
MLFLGCERDLLIFNILTYSIFDFWLNNTASAIFLCYLLDCAVTYYRRTLGRVSGLISCLKLHFFVSLISAEFFVMFYASYFLINCFYYFIYILF